MRLVFVFFFNINVEVLVSFVISSIVKFQKMSDATMDSEPSSAAEVEPKSESDQKANLYAYTKRPEFTSENFKIEVRGLPKYYGLGVSPKTCVRDADTI